MPKSPNFTKFSVHVSMLPMSVVRYNKLTQTSITAAIATLNAAQQTDNTISHVQS